MTYWRETLVVLSSGASVHSHNGSLKTHKSEWEPGGSCCKMDEKLLVLKAAAPGLLSEVEHCTTMWRDCSWCAGLLLFCEPVNQSFMLNRQKQAIAAESGSDSYFHDDKSALVVFCGVWTRAQPEQCLLKEAGITVGRYGNKVCDAELLVQNEAQIMQLWLKDTVWSSVCTWRLSLSELGSCSRVVKPGSSSQLSDATWSKPKFKPFKKRFYLV